jgi:hypothetical protein
VMENIQVRNGRGLLAGLWGRGQTRLVLNVVSPRSLLVSNTQLQLLLRLAQMAQLKPESSCYSRIQSIKLVMLRSDGQQSLEVNVSNRGFCMAYPHTAVIHGPLQFSIS